MHPILSHENIWPLISGYKGNDTPVLLELAPLLHFELRNPQERALNALEFGITIKDQILHHTINSWSFRLRQARRRPH